MPPVTLYLPTTGQVHTFISERPARVARRTGWEDLPPAPEHYCEPCDREFTTAAGLTRHRNAVHPDPPDPHE